MYDSPETLIDLYDGICLPSIIDSNATASTNSCSGVKRYLLRSPVVFCFSFARSNFAFFIFNFAEPKSFLCMAIIA